MTDEHIDFNPKFKDPRTYDWSKALNTLEGYTSPIAMSFEQIANEIRERQENAVVATISERMAVDIDKNELTKALAYDREQYSEGFRAGYKRALFDINLQLDQAVGILNDILNQNREKVRSCETCKYMNCEDWCANCHGDHSLWTDTNEGGET